MQLEKTTVIAAIVAGLIVWALISVLSAWMAWRAEEIVARRQDGVVRREEDYFMDYDEAKVRRSIVHTREDIILVYLQLSRLVGQLAGIRAAVTIIAVAVVMLMVGLYRPPPTSYNPPPPLRGEKLVQLPPPKTYKLPIRETFKSY